MYSVQIVLPLQTTFMPADSDSPTDSDPPGDSDPPPTDTDPWTKYSQSLAFQP